MLAAVSPTRAGHVWPRLSTTAGRWRSRSRSTCCEPHRGPDEPGRHGDLPADRTMTLYEGLSLLVSALGILSTVYIGVRQLQRPAAAVPTPAYARPAPAYVAPPSYLRRAPGLITAGCLLLYAAAATQPVVFALYYGVRYATAPAGTSRAFGDDVVIDVLVLGGIALVSALLGVFVARRSRVAQALVVTLGALSTLLLVAMGLALLGLLVDPSAPPLTGLDLLGLGYLLVVVVAYIGCAALLLPTSSRGYFRRT